MQAVDTNVLLRALITDPSAPEQCARATAWVAAQAAIFVSQIVQAELAWWLRKSPAVIRANRTPRNARPEAERDITYRLFWQIGWPQAAHNEKFV